MHTHIFFYYNIMPLKHEHGIGTHEKNIVGIYWLIYRDNDGHADKYFSTNNIITIYAERGRKKHIENCSLWYIREDNIYS